MEETDILIESLEIEYSRLLIQQGQLLKAGGFIIQELDKSVIRQVEIEGQLATLTGEVPLRSELLSFVNRNHIEKTLEVCNGNKSQAARVLGIDRKALLRRVYKYGLKGGNNEGVTGNSTS